MIEQQQLAFGEKLRQLREQAGYGTGKDFAARLGWQATKVSRIETGRTMPSDSDLIAWLAAIDAPESMAAQLRSELLDLRVAKASWRRRLAAGHAPIQRQQASREASATHIVTFELALVPGLVQTAEYARAVLTSAAAEMADVMPKPDTEAAVTARIRRQEILYDPSKRIEVLVTESALRYRVCPASVLIGQIDRIASLIGLSNLRVGVIPFSRRLPVVPLHGYMVLDNEIVIELNHTELAVTDPNEIAVYRHITELLWSAALESEGARTFLATIASDIASSA